MVKGGITKKNNESPWNRDGLPERGFFEEVILREGLKPQGFKKLQFKPVGEFFRVRRHR